MSEEIKYNGQPVYTGKNEEEINRKQDTYFGGKTWDKLSQEEKDEVHRQLVEDQWNKKEISKKRNNVIEVDFSQGRE